MYSKSSSEGFIAAPYTVLLTHEDRHKLLFEFNETQWQYPEKETLVSLFVRQAACYPRHVAVRYLHEHLCYQELDQKSSQLAHYLIARGIRPGMLVPIWLNRSLEWLVAVIGIVKTGAAYVPIDPAYPVKRAAYIIGDTDAPIVITSKTYGEQLDNGGDTELFYIEQLSSLCSLPVHQPDVAPGDLAYVIYTSGSTGKPKGVMVSHQSIQHLVTWHNHRFDVGAASHLSLVAGLAFDISVWETWSALTAGASLYIATDEERTDSAALLEYFCRNQITHGFVPTVLVPSFIGLCDGIMNLQLGYLFTAGEQLKPVLTAGLPFELVDYYGPTECTVYATGRIVKEQDSQFVSSIGKPIANTRAYILNDQLELLPPGAVGELCISGTALAKGYLNNRELTERKFVDHPYRPGEKLYRTGDLARWLPDGNIQFLGRRDNQVKIRGFRVELGEVERVLTRIAGIKDAVVIAVDSAENNKYLVAFIVPEEDATTVDIAGIRQQLKQELPGYMMPAQVIPVNKIPVTENGKTDRKWLAELAETQSREILLSEPPTNETERIMVEIWSETLKRPVINITDNFFDIGGDSLLVAVVVTAMAKRLKVKIYMRDIYQYPVLQQLAALLIVRAKETGAAVPGEDVEPFVELKNDVCLAPGTVFAGGFDSKRAEDPSAIFLTGATGFVGVHLLQELLDTTSADIYCLVRAQDAFHAMEKINQCFAEYRIEGDVAQRQRIIPVIGDLTVPFLGLSPGRFDFFSKHIDIIYHSGSSVNFIEPYSYMKSPNVEGLREIIRLAGAGRTKCLALLSTISVYSWGHVFTHKTTMFETDDIEQNLLAVSKDIGYVRSKWVMEAIADLASREGLPVITYRLGYAMCHSKTGASAPYQWWAGLVKNCIEFKSYPLLTELREGLTTVDYMAKAIAFISRNPEAVGRKFNLIARPETNLTLEEFFGLLQAYYPFVLKGLPYKEWRKQWEDDSSNRLFPLTSLFKDNMHEGLSTVELYQHTYIWDCAQVTGFLEGSGIQEPVFDKELLDIYLAYLEIPIQ